MSLQPERLLEIDTECFSDEPPLFNYSTPHFKCRYREMANPQQRVRAKRQCNTRLTRPDLVIVPLIYRDVCVFTSHPTNLIDERRRGSTPE